MGGTFRFMTYFVKVLAFLCACAYKGAKVYSFTHFLQTQTPLKKLYMFYLKQSHCVYTIAWSRSTPTAHVPCYYHITLVCYLLQKNKTLHAGVRVILLSQCSLPRMTVSIRLFSAQLFPCHRPTILQANIFVRYSVFWTHSKVGPIYVESNFALLLLQSQWGTLRNRCDERPAMLNHTI